MDHKEYTFCLFIGALGGIDGKGHFAPNKEYTFSDKYFDPTKTGNEQNSQHSHFHYHKFL